MTASELGFNRYSLRREKPWSSGLSPSTSVGSSGSSVMPHFWAIAGVFLTYLKVHLAGVDRARRGRNRRWIWIHGFTPGSAAGA
jgi:hypothetical protein